MPSLISRLRKRTISGVSTSASSEPLPATPTAWPDTLPTIIHSPFLDRKILANPDSFLTSHNDEEDEPVQVPKGLKPSPRRASLDALRRLAGPADEEAAAEAGIVEEVIKSSAMFGQTRANRLDWSTFGRHGPGSTPHLNDFIFNEPGASAPPTRAKYDLVRSGSSNSRRSSVPSRGARNQSQRDASPSDSNTISSTNHSSAKPRPYSLFATSTPKARPRSRTLGHEASQTFGAPLPPLPVSNSSYYTALDLNSTSTTTRKNTDIALSALTTIVTPHMHEDYEDRERTYPRRRLPTWARGAGSSSLPNTLRKKSNRSYPSLPKQLFMSAASPARQTRSPSPKINNPTPARSGSSKSRKKPERRLSAEWNSVQAIEGETEWPALVSREILRLSAMVGGPGKANATGAAAAEADPALTVTCPENVPRNVPVLGLPAGHGRSSPHSPALGLTLPQEYIGSDLYCILSGTPSHQHHGLFISGDATRTMHPQKQIFQFERAAGNNALPLGIGPPPKFEGGSVDAVHHQYQPSSPPPSTGLLQIPPSLSVTSPTPETSPFRPTASSSTSSVTAVPAPTASSLQIPTVLKTPSDKSKGKRKAEDVESTPPDQKKATFAPIEPRPLRVSDSSHAPSSYQNKRARISTPLPTPPHSRPASTQQGGHFGSWPSSRASSRSRGSPEKIPPRAPSRAASTRSQHQQQPHQQSQEQQQTNNNSQYQFQRRTSLSGVSIPISALVSPHAPSVSRSSKFHMQDPRKPPRQRDTGWALRFRDEDDAGSPVQAWFFFVGFVLFPLWWVAAFTRTPQTRRVGGSDTEKAVMLDDPQVERDAKSWRFRCRVMSFVSLFTYIPFIILVAIFAPR